MLIKSIKTTGTIQKYLVQIQSEKQVTKSLLGSANGDIQRMAFGEVATSRNVEDFRGFYTCDSLTNQPMKFFVCDLYKHHFNELGVFKKSYQLGDKNKLEIRPIINI